MNYYLVSGTARLMHSEYGWMLYGDDGEAVAEEEIYVEPQLICADNQSQAGEIVLNRALMDHGAIDAKWLHCDAIPEPADQAMRRMGAPLLPGFGNG